MGELNFKNIFIYLFNDIMFLTPIGKSVTLYY